MSKGKRFQQFITSLTVGVLMLTMLVRPMPARAQGIPVIDVTQISQETAQTVGQKILKALGNAALGAIRGSLNAFLQKLAYDTATWIATGDHGQDSLFVTEDDETFWSNAADVAAGGAIEQAATAAGLNAAGICNPGGDFGINLTLGLDVTAQQPYKPACTLSELSGNWEEAFSDPNFGDLVNMQWDSTANPLGASLEVENLQIVASAEAVDAAKSESAREFKQVTETVSGYVKTPSATVKQQLATTQLAQNEAWQLLGNPVVDAVAVFSTTLTSKLMERLMTGLADAKAGNGLSAIISGEGTGAASGRAAAQARFAELRQPVFASSGTFDIIAELSSCPDDVGLRTVNNCSIGPTTAIAIQEGWTTQELVDYFEEVGNDFRFVDETLTAQEVAQDAGITYQGILVLKKYRIIPVGWDLAAQYINDDSNQESKTLSELVDEFDNCDSGDDYSPYCKLVDPYWVLKAHANFCQREAPGPDFASKDKIDDDVNAATPEAIILNRLNYCADNRGCIQEEEEGVCTAYGYCTEEERTYRFAGDTCDEEYASCETFTNEDDEDISYLKSSINYNDCATDPGCQWYCLSTNESGLYDCASPTETFITCNEDYADSDAVYSYDEQVSCACEVQDTCIVRAGSDLGDDSGSYEYIEEGDSSASDTVADGIYDFYQCRVYPDASQPDAYAICDLGEACGAGNPNYDDSLGYCTCTIDYSCDADSGDSSCEATVTGDNDTDGDGVDETLTIGCDLDDEDADSSADSCTSEYSTYSDAPVCSPSGSINCGDTCIVSDGSSSCTNSLGNTCEDGGDLDSDGSVNGECTLADTCDISDGQFSCSTDNGNLCVIGTQEEDPAEENDTIYFDANVQECDSGDAGCSNYIRTLSDTNILPNSQFNYYDGDLDDSSTDFVGFCTHDGSGCYTDADCYEDVNGDGLADTSDPAEQVGECKGWIQSDVAAQVVTQSTLGLTPIYGENALQVIADGDASTTGNVYAEVDTGYTLADRTFSLAYRAYSGEATLYDCDYSFSLGGIESDGTEYVLDTITSIEVDDTTTLDAYESDWNEYYGTFTFPEDGDSTYSSTGSPGTTIKLSIQNHDDCSINIDAVQLVEAEEYDTSFSAYNDNNSIYLNSSNSCEPEDVGCELYVEDGRDEEDGIPGKITNPESDVCVDASGNYNYDNPSCNQCDGNPAEDQDDNYYAGCDFYQEVSLDRTIPITTDYGSLLSTEERDGIMQRYGGRCSSDPSESCFEASDCSTSGDVCELQTSIVPSSGQQCPASVVGCEEYTNLEAAAEGGESLSYYSELQQCVKENDDDTDTFFTFEGSDDGGIQITDHFLKVVHDTGTANDGAPCTTLDWENESYNADCQDFVTVTPNDCGPSGDDVYGSDLDCRQYINDEGDIFYRYESEVIIATDECTTLRNTLDTRVYFAVPGDSASCSASYNGCREYKGTDSGSALDVVDEEFDSNSTEEWVGADTTSNEEVLQGGYSLALHTATSSASSDFSGYTEYEEITYDLWQENDGETVGTLTPGQSYVLSFWAKVTDADAQLLASIDPLMSSVNTYYYFTNDGSDDTRADSAIDLDPNSEGDWQFYQLGPIILDASAEEDDQSVTFNLQFMDTTGSAEGYIDNILLTESDSQYLIQDSYNYCLNFEGCREYKDRNDNTHYLKSFDRLCEEGAVGCEALINTYNSSNPFTEGYNFDNEYDEDDVVVQYDQPITLVYDEENECSSEVRACKAVGLPEVDERTGYVEEFTTTYLRDLPDDYTSTLCEQPQLSCQAYESTYDGTVYFKDPGDKVCTLEEYTTDEGTLLGWFKKDSDATEPDCPVQYDYADKSYPLGGLCNSNSVSFDEDGSVNDSLIGELCNSDSDCYPSGWSSSDPRPRCISNPEDDVDLFDGSVHQYAIRANDELSLDTDDFGWVGTCPSSQSGCTEYIDPYSPNIEEITRNWSFENDVRNQQDTYYANEETADGFPDYWYVNSNAGEEGTGEYEDADEDGFADDEIMVNTTLDLDNDGTADFPAECHSYLPTEDTYPDAYVYATYGASTNTAAMTNSNDYSDVDVTPVDGDSALFIEECALENNKLFSYERDKLYTLSAFVKLPLIPEDDRETILPNYEFSIGLRYYDEDFNEVEVDDSDQMFIVADHATIEPTSYAVDDSDNQSEWYKWQGNIGIGSTVEFPDPDTNGNCNGGVGPFIDFSRTSCENGGGEWYEIKYASPFVANHYSSPIWFDAVSFKENDKYYYLDYTVDGTSEHDSEFDFTTCEGTDGEGEITSDGGCVGFRDTTYDSQIISQDSIECATCLLTPNSDSCRNVVDACDTNAVIKVKRDRVCSEWLACETAAVVTDEEGNEASQCFSIGRCVGLDEDGNCIDWKLKPSTDELTTLTDLHYTTAGGDNDELSAIRNLTGYSKVGMTWLDTQVCDGGESSGESCEYDTDCGPIYGSCSGDECVSGDNLGDIGCQADADDNGVAESCGETGTYYECRAPIEVQGYFPYGWMVEIGGDGAEAENDFIEHRSFENLYCAGEDADPTQACIVNASGFGETSPSPSAGNCFRTEFEDRLTNDDTDVGTTDNPYTYVEGTDLDDYQG